MNSIFEADLEGFSVLVRRGRFISAVVPRGDSGHHRTVDSHAFIVFADERQAKVAATAMRKGDVLKFIGKADAAVFDPDLGLGDFGVDVVGDVTKLPPAMQKKLSAVKGYYMSRRGVAPVPLSVAEAQALETEFVGPERYVKGKDDGEAHPDLFRMDLGYQHIGVFHRNTMNFENAVKGLIRDGMLDTVDGRTPAEYERHVNCSQIRAEYDGPFVKAPRRKAGTAPVSSYTMENYGKFLQALGAEESEYPLPELDKDAKKLIDRMSKEYRARKAAGTLPPSYRQLQFAGDIARCLQIELPEGAKQNKGLLEGFIDEHKEAFSLRQQEERNSARASSSPSASAP